MSRLRKALALSASEWLLIAQAWLWFGALEVGLRCLSLQKLLRIIQHSRNLRTNARRGGRKAHSTIPERAAYCVELAARLYLLDATCLKKALVLYALLTRRAFEAQLSIGAARPTKGQLDAHAWLECQGKVLLGEPMPGRYPTLCVLPGSTLHTVQPNGPATS